MYLKALTPSPPGSRGLIPAITNHHQTRYQGGEEQPRHSVRIPCGQTPFSKQSPLDTLTTQLLGLSPKSPVKPWTVLGNSHSLSLTAQSRACPPQMHKEQVKGCLSHLNGGCLGFGRKGVLGSHPRVDSRLGDSQRLWQELLESQSWLKHSVKQAATSREHRQHQHTQACPPAAKLLWLALTWTEEGVWQGKASVSQQRSHAKSSVMELHLASWPVYGFEMLYVEYMILSKRNARKLDPQSTLSIPKSSQITSKKPTSRLNKNQTP